MKCLLVILACALWEAQAYPYYPYYGNMDSFSFGSTDNSRGGIALSRYYNPYYNPRAVGGTAAFMFKPPETQAHQFYQSSNMYVPDRRRQVQQDPTVPPQENEIFYQQPEKPKPTDIIDPTEKSEPPTTVKTYVPEFVEADIENVEDGAPIQKPNKRVPKKKQDKRPVEDEEEDDEPKMPKGAFFPMFFGYNGRSGGGAPGGATAIANAYSTGRGGVATSHATAYGTPTDFKTYQQQRGKYYQE